MQTEMEGMTLKKSTSADSMPAFSRHSSFDQILMVAEAERQRMFGATSEPESPVKKLDFDKGKICFKLRTQTHTHILG